MENIENRTPKTCGPRPFLKKGEGITGKYKVNYSQIGKAVATSTPKSVNYFNEDQENRNHDTLEFEKVEQKISEKINSEIDSKVEEIKDDDKLNFEISDLPVNDGLRSVDEFISQKRDLPKIYTPSNITNDSSTSTMGFIKNKYGHLLNSGSSTSSTTLNTNNTTSSSGRMKYLGVVMEEEQFTPKINKNDIVVNLANQLRDLIVHIDYASLQLRSRQDLYETMRQQKFEAQVIELDKQMKTFEYEKISLLEKQTRCQKLIQKQKEQIETLTKDKDDLKSLSDKYKEIVSTKDTRIANLRSKITQLENSIKEKENIIKENEKRQARRSLPSTLKSSTRSQSPTMNLLQKSSVVSDIKDIIRTELINQQKQQIHHNISDTVKNVRWKSPIVDCTDKSIYCSSLMKLIKFDVDSKGDCISTYSDGKCTTEHIVKACECEHYEYSNDDKRWEHSTGKFHMYYYSEEGVTSLILTDEWKLLYHSGSGQIDLYKSDGQVILIQSSGDRVEFSRNDNAAIIYMGNENKYIVTPTTITPVTDNTQESHYADGSYIARRRDNSIEFVSPVFALRRDSTGNAKLSIVLLDIQISLLIHDVVCIKHLNKTNYGINKTICCLWGKNSHLVC
uniref:Guanine nucleotide-binding protein subunit beta-like protein n=1 Tax=Strongyloides venezuelensis TaxID=75913 RepID=A0A0K0G0I2_STRVS